MAKRGRSVDPVQRRIWRDAVERWRRSVTLSATALTLLLRGIDLRSVRQRKRYRRESA